MDKKNSATPAFPFVVDKETDFSIATGLSKREYFAAIAMQGLLAADQSFDRPESIIARLARQQADALIEELNNEP